MINVKKFNKYKVKYRKRIKIYSFIMINTEFIFYINQSQVLKKFNN